MQVEHFPEGVPITTLDADFKGVGAISEDRIVVIVAARHSGKLIPISLSHEDAGSLLECLTDAIKAGEARRSNSN